MSVFHDHDTGLKLEAGANYINGHGDLCGPMEERTPGTWLDQHGALYHANGIQWNHTHDSAGNLKRRYPSGSDGESQP